MTRCEIFTIGANGVRYLHSVTLVLLVTVESLQRDFFHSRMILLRKLHTSQCFSLLADTPNSLRVPSPLSSAKRCSSWESNLNSFLHKSLFLFL